MPACTGQAMAGVGKGGGGEYLYKGAISGLKHAANMPNSRSRNPAKVYGGFIRRIYLLDKFAYFP